MIAPPQRIIADESELLLALRELLAQHPATRRGPETLARLLWVLRYLPYRPSVFEIEAALEALTVEDGVLA